MRLPHHDGSLVDNPAPALGDRVTVRVYGGPGVSNVDVRTVADGEPRFVAASSADGLWWRATVEVRNPVTPYRFLLRGRSTRWLNAAGVCARDVPDAHDFRLVAGDPPPTWAADAIVYQIFPDRFARSGVRRDPPDWAIPCDWDTPVIGRGPETPRQFYGGDLDGIAARLDHIAALGANTVYLTPIFPARSNHRYDATAFDRVDPLLGGDDALKRLGCAVRDKDLRLLGDLTTNHCGSGHPWCAEPELFYPGPDGSYECWLGVRDLPKLNWGSAAVRSRFLDGPDAIAARWLSILDGWRVDVANMTGRRADDDHTHEVARLLRRAVTRARPDALLVAEHGHDATGDLDRGGWHGTMNYAGFTRPVWSWLANFHASNFLGVPGEIYPIDAGDVVATMRDFGGLMSWRSLTHSWTLLGSHDTARIRTVVGSAALQEVAAGLLFTLPGTPMVFAGDEWGLTGTNGEGSRTPMPWDRPERQDAKTFARYRDLIALRSANPALRRGGLRWAYADGDTLAFFRDSLLVLARRAPGPPLHLSGRAENLYGGMDLTDREIPGDGPTFQVWRLHQRDDAVDLWR